MHPVKQLGNALFAGSGTNMVVVGIGGHRMRGARGMNVAP
jgi:hypothetical protein